MTNGAKLDELTPMQIWTMVFHPQKGAIAVINKSISELCDEMKTLESNLKKYNGLPERLTIVEKAVKHQNEFCAEVQNKFKTEDAVELALEGARLKGAQEEKDRFNKAMLLWGKILATITVVTGLITWFMGIW